MRFVPVLGLLQSGQGAGQSRQQRNDALDNCWPAACCDQPGKAVRSAMTKRDARIDAIAASDLSSAAIRAKNILSDDQVQEVYEQALFLLEAHEDEEPEMGLVFEAARGIIEAQLR